jgi:hypothetical protein
MARVLGVGCKVMFDDGESRESFKHSEAGVGAGLQRAAVNQCHVKRHDRKFTICTIRSLTKRSQFAVHNRGSISSIQHEKRAFYRKPDRANGASRCRLDVGFSILFRFSLVCSKMHFM